MALHRDFPDDPHAILDPAIRWFPADEPLRSTSFEKLLPPLVPTLRKEAQAWRNSGYDGAAETSKALLRWWFAEQHLLSKADGSLHEFRYFFAQREALETIVYLHDVVGVKDKYHLMRFDSSRTVSTGMFDETWRRFVVKMARLKQWCDDINQAQNAVRYDFVFVDEEGFKKYRPGSFAALVKSFREYRA